MKKCIRIALFSIFVVFLLFSFAGCSDNSENKVEESTTTSINKGENYENTTENRITANNTNQLENQSVSTTQNDTETQKNEKVYTQEELEQMALNYYEKKTGYRPGMVASMINSDGKLTIQLYDNMGDHNSTCDWYTIDMETAKGTNIMEEEVDLTDTK